MNEPQEIKKRQLIMDARRPYRILCLDGGKRNPFYCSRFGFNNVIHVQVESVGL
jgi:hypothetical protein